MFTVRDIWPHPWSAYLYHAPPPEYILCRKHDSIEQNFTIISSLLHSTYFPWPNFLSMGIVDISFLSVETGKYATPNGHLNFHFTPLSALFPSASYKLFPWWNQRQLDFFTIKPISTFQFSSGKFHMGHFRRRAAKWPLSGLFKDSWDMLPYTVHVTPLMCASKIARNAWQNDFCVRLVEQGKEKDWVLQHKPSLVPSLSPRVQTKNRKERGEPG